MDLERRLTSHASGIAVKKEVFLKNKRARKFLISYLEYSFFLVS